MIKKDINLQRKITGIIIIYGQYISRVHILSCVCLCVFSKNKDTVGAVKGNESPAVTYSKPETDKKAPDTE